MLARTLAGSIVIAIGIAVALSFLPSIDMASQGEVSVFRSESPSSLTKETLVDFLTLYPSQLSYRHVEWDEDHHTLHVDFTVADPLVKAEIAEDWLQFTRHVFLATNNVEALLCRLYKAEEGELLASLKVRRNDLEERLLEQVVGREKVIDYMEDNFDFQMR